MMTETVIPWSHQMVCLSSEQFAVELLAREVYNRVCRTTFELPGFCVINAGATLGSVPFRQLMVDIKQKMAAIHEQRTGKTLIYLSAARFDQQNSTKPHLDGGPDESLLLLGYEPSDIDAELEISDYTRCAADLGISPKEFMAQHNPMFRAGFEMLRPYATAVPCFDPGSFQIVVINNSSAPIDGQSWLGTLHTATILNADETKRRVINSTMLCPAPLGTPDAISGDELQEFIHTTRVRRKGYDKTHLDDDA
jgi:hypothetical protein